MSFRFGLVCILMMLTEVAITSSMQRMRRIEDLEAEASKVEKAWNNMTAEKAEISAKDYITFSVSGQNKSLCVTYYVLHDIKTNYINAMYECDQQKYHLATIETPEEYYSLIEYFQKNYAAKESFWISGINLKNGDYIWESTEKQVPIFISEKYRQDPNASIMTKLGQNCFEIRGARAVDPKEKNPEFVLKRNYCISQHYPICEERTQQTL